MFYKVERFIRDKDMEAYLNKLPYSAEVVSINTTRAEDEKYPWFVVTVRNPSEFKVDNPERLKMESKFGLNSK